jgi:hypothetical protein
MNFGQRRIAGVLCAALLAMVTVRGSAGPAHDPSRQELESVLADLIAWLPGGWDSYPQVHFERRYRMPAEGEHEHWHHIFERIDAPQIGEVVFYGQINPGGRDAPMMHRSQILYKVWIDEQRGVVVINGQGPADPDKYVDLHERPELWSEVRMRDPAKINCDFIWRRDGEQIVGVLDGKTAAGRTQGPGTCTYMVNNTDVRFIADAEWVLSPEVFWDYDLNEMAGHQFIGRKDRTHIKMYRARGYDCVVRDAQGERRWQAYDRGAKLAVQTAAGSRQLMLLRASMPDAAGRGLHDKLRLLLQKPGEEAPVHESEAEPRAASITLAHEGVSAQCSLAKSLPRMHKAGVSAAH